MPSNSTAERIISNVRAEMARRKHTQTSLAKELNRSQQFLSRRLAGTVPFDIQDLLAIANALDIELAELLDTAGAA